MMKLSYTYATPDTNDTKMLAMRGDAGHCFAFLSSHGYKGVELMVRDVSKLNPSQLSATARDHNLEVCAVSTGQLRAEDGLSLSDLSESKRQQAVSRCKEVVDFCAMLNVPMNIGTLRGFQAAQNKASSMASAAKSFEELFRYAETRNVLIAIEPQNRYTINWLNNVRETLAWMDSFSSPSARIVFDIYHWMLEERDIAESLVLSRDRIAHVQFSDSNRGIPGTGHINFYETIDILDALGYTGFVSIEAVQKPDSFEVAKRAGAFLNRRLQKCAAHYTTVNEKTPAL